MCKICPLSLGTTFIKVRTSWERTQRGNHLSVVMTSVMDLLVALRALFSALPACHLGVEVPICEATTATSVVQTVHLKHLHGLQVMAGPAQRWVSTGNNRHNVR